VVTSAGAVEVTAPRVNDKRTDPDTGERMRFSSAILPPWARRTPQVAEVLPLLYLHGLSSGDFVPALGQFLGSHAGLSASTITRLTEQWKDEAAAFMTRDLSGVDYVYLWVDGIHLGIRLSEGKLCLLVMIGVRVDGRKELVAVADGYRESAESWADLLRDCARRGMRAPVLAVGDGALGLWKAVREVLPETKEQRCWFHCSCKDSTCCVMGRGVWRGCRGGEQVAAGAVAGWRWRGDMAGLVEEREGFADGVADRGPADTQEAGQHVHRARVPLVEDGQQDALSVADLLVEDAAAGSGLAEAAAPLIAEALGLGGLQRRELPGEVLQAGAAEPGQRRMGELFDDACAPGAGVAVEEHAKCLCGGEADGRRAGGVAVVLEDFPGFPDQVTDAGGGDFEQVGEHVHRARLPLVEEGEQDAGGIVEQRLAA